MILIFIPVFSVNLFEDSFAWLELVVMKDRTGLANEDAMGLLKVN